MSKELITLQNAVPITTEKSIDIASLIILYAVQNPNKPYNVYRYSYHYPDGYNELKRTLDDMILMIAYEMYMDLLESHGAILYDHPASVEDTIYAFNVYGVCYADELYLHALEIVESIECRIKHSKDHHSSESPFITFLKAMRKYTDVNCLVSKMFGIMYEFVSFEKLNSDKFLSEYADVIPKLISDAVDYDNFSNDVVLEYTSQEIKNEDLFPFTYYEYFGIIKPEMGELKIDTESVFKNIYERLLKGEEISEEEIDGEY